MPSLSPQSGERASARPDLGAGIGLRAQHHDEILKTRPTTGWFEAHSENYFAAGSAHRAALQDIRSRYPVSLHGVGLSLGSTDPLDAHHLRSLKQLVDEIQPVFVSEHLSWGSVDGRHLNDLLPLPHTEEALGHMVARVQQVQDALARPILIENISTYLRFMGEEMPEWRFLSLLAQKSGCGLLLDINNLYVNAMNHGFDPLAFLHGIVPAAVSEFHVAGHAVTTLGGQKILIDTHNARVAAAVWDLYERAVRALGLRPTLIEWDADIPSLPTLLDEAARADRIMERHRAAAA